MQGIRGHGLNGSGGNPTRNDGEDNRSSSFVVPPPQAPILLPFSYSNDQVDVYHQIPHILGNSSSPYGINGSYMQPSLMGHNSRFPTGELPPQTPSQSEIPSFGVSLQSQVFPTALLHPMSALVDYPLSSSSSSPSSPYSFSSSSWSFGLEMSQEHTVVGQGGEQGVDGGTGTEIKDNTNEGESKVSPNTYVVQLQEDSKNNVGSHPITGNMYLNTAAFPTPSLDANQANQSFILQPPPQCFVEFTGAELKKMMYNERLSQIARTDPKRAKRILANRQSAARSKERKAKYVVEMERKMRILHNDVKALSAKLSVLKRNFVELGRRNQELRSRLDVLDYQSRIKEALNDALKMEVQRLRFQILNW